MALRAAGVACVALGVACGPPAVTNPAKYVKPTMGSGGYGYAYGAAFPGASVPSGMMRVGPDTSGPYATTTFLHFSGYWGGDNKVLALSHTHLQGTGSQDYGHLGLLPVPAFVPGQLRVEDYTSTFAKASEEATPGYYSVVLDNGSIHAEMTATTHASHERFTYPNAATGTLIIDTAHTITGGVDGATVTLASSQDALSGDFQTHGGMSGGYHLYFAMQFKHPWTAQRTWADGAAPSNAATQSGTGVGVALDFDTSGGTPVEVQVGLSLVSAAGAAANLAEEMKSWDFDSNHSDAEAAWNKRLKSLTVYGGSETQRTTFYSALHHAFVMPGVYSDNDGQYMFHRPGQTNGAFHFMTDISGWDVYRTLMPLYHLVAPDISLDVIQSMYAMAQQSGEFPKWPLAASDSGSMVGSSADVIVADAYARGITGFDVAGAYQYLRDAALDPSMPMGESRGGRGNCQPDYLQYGRCLPSDGASVSLTCEYSQEDYALAQIATGLAKGADASRYQADAQTLLARSNGYEKLYDASSGFLRAHNLDGTIPPSGFSPSDFSDGEFVESDAYQSMFCIQHDIDGLASLWGGKAQLAEGIEKLFESSKTEHEALVAASEGEDPFISPLSLPPAYYFAGNEPDVHYAYLMAQAGRPDFTQEWVPWIMNTFFSSASDGLPGNDDGGTMSAWYVWSALGLYPVPGSDQYVIGTPEFPRVDIQVPGGVFSVIADGVSSAHIYVQSATLNGKTLKSAVIHQSDLKKGGSLELQMGPKPSSWARSN
jgi:predicted alpha-1,2-mannosidase